MADPSDDTRLSRAVGFGESILLFSDEVAALRERIFAAADELGGTRDADLRLLLEVARQGLAGETLIQKQLVTDFQWSDRTLSDDLDRLEQGEYITRPPGSDKRTKEVALTPKGSRSSCRLRSTPRRREHCCSAAPFQLADSLADSSGSFRYRELAAPLR